MRGLAFCTLLAGCMLIGAPAAAIQFIFTVDGPYAISFAISKDRLPDTFTASSVSFLNVRSLLDGQLATVIFDLDADVSSISVAPNPGVPLTVDTDPVFFIPYQGLRPVIFQGAYTVSGQYGAAHLNITEELGEPDPIPMDPPPPPPPPPPPHPPEPPAAPVPEPATWTLMIAGMTVAGLAMRRRRRVHES